MNTIPLIQKSIVDSPIVSIIAIIISAVIFAIWMIIDSSSLSKFNGYDKPIAKSGHKGRNEANKRTRKRRALEKRLGLPHLSLYAATDKEMNALKKKHGIY